MRSITILILAVCACMSSCRNRSAEKKTDTVISTDADTVVQEASTQNLVKECMDTTVVVTETDRLRLYKPVFGSVGLSLHPSKADNRVFMAAAAYTRTYTWTKFDQSLIAGPHIDGGYYAGYDEPANSGAFYYIGSSNSWGFVHDGFEKTLKEGAAKEGYTSGFSQVMLVYEGKACSIHSNANPRKLALRRALCELNGELYIIDSKREVTMNKFVEFLISEGVKNALYMDMGGMKHSLYKKYNDGDWIEIHPANAKTKYCTNYLVFYYAN